MRFQECARAFFAGHGVYSMVVWLVLLAGQSAWAKSGDFPDYAVVGGVVTDDGLVDLAPELPVLLDRLLGTQHLVVDFAPDDGATVWARDFQPIYRLDPGGVGVTGYNSKNTNRRYFSGLAWGQRHRRPADRLGLFHENGNLVLTERYAFISERLLADNEGGSKAIIEQFAEALDRSVDEVMVVPGLPDEGTEHVDLWILALGPQEVMVPRIEPKALALSVAVDLPRAREAAQMLDTWAKRLGRAGLTVHRLPMIAPFVVPPVIDEGFTPEGDVIYVSPANVLLLNLGDRRHVVVPHVAIEHLAAGRTKVAQLQVQYERKWSQFFEKNGWSPEFFESTRLVHHLGLARCVTAPFPVAQRPAL